MKTTKEKIAVMQAFEDGKNIEVKAISWTEWQPVAIYGAPSWDWNNYDYRIKPDPKLRPWKPEEVPVGALMKTKLGHGGRYMIVGLWELTLKNLIQLGPPSAESGMSAETAMNNWLHSTDHGKTWLPCGVVE